MKIGDVIDPAGSVCAAAGDSDFAGVVIEGRHAPVALNALLTPVIPLRLSQSSIGGSRGPVDGIVIIAPVVGRAVRSFLDVRIVRNERPDIILDEAAIAAVITVGTNAGPSQDRETLAI